MTNPRFALAHLKQLEVILDESIPQVSEISWITFGYVIDNAKITGLGLCEKYSGSFPETNLKFRNFRDIQLTSVPEAIGHLTNLKYLSLANNQLKTLPEALGQHTNLKELH